MAVVEVVEGSTPGGHLGEGSESRIGHVWRIGAVLCQFFACGVVSKGSCLRWSVGGRVSWRVLAGLLGDVAGATGRRDHCCDRLLGGGGALGSCSGTGDLRVFGGNGCDCALSLGGGGGKSRCRAGEHPGHCLHARKRGLDDYCYDEVEEAAIGFSAGSGGLVVGARCCGESYTQCRFFRGNDGQCLFWTGFGCLHHL